MKFTRKEAKMLRRAMDALIAHNDSPKVSGAEMRQINTLKAKLNHWLLDPKAKLIDELLAEHGYTCDFGDFWLNIATADGVNMEYDVQFSGKGESWQDFEYAYLTASYDLGSGEQMLDFEIGGEHDEHDVLAIAKNVLAVAEKIATVTDIASRKK